MNEHSARLHSVWAASATSRNVICAGAIALETLCEERESEAAAWGTASHQLAERCFTDVQDAGAFLGDVIKSGKFEFTVDEEMVDCTQTYVDHVREESRGATWVKIEQKFSLAALNPPLEAGGTGDAILYFAERKHLKVKDLKGGRGVIVEVKGNMQMRTYALCALLAYSDIEVDTIEITIIQPRADHKDGRIRSETFHVTDLIDWTVDLLAAMQRSKDALDEFEAVKFESNTKKNPDRAAFEAWADKWLKTGQCIFCNAKAICPKIKAEALALAGAKAAQWFETVDETPIVLPDPKLLAPAELARLLDGFDMLTSWVNAIRAYAHGLAERGTEVPGYQLADKIGNRAFIEKDQQKLLAQIVAKLNISLTDAVEPAQVKSVAQIEKTLGSKRKSELAALEGTLWERPKRGTNLVASVKTSRAPALSKPETFFETVK